MGGWQLAGKYADLLCVLCVWVYGTRFRSLLRCWRVAFLVVIVVLASAIRHGGCPFRTGGVDLYVGVGLLLVYGVLAAWLFGFARALFFVVLRSAVLRFVVLAVLGCQFWCLAVLRPGVQPSYLEVHRRTRRTRAGARASRVSVNVKANVNAKAGAE